ncbi:PAS domain-containing protein [Francisella sp. LA112445]|jgi:DUF438 domain-containing protein|uniref:PAS domain-containing protein n=1 Tax=Francisella sp. LA112445 TaxID=1395624 RepID=UPI001788C46E|nr:PAS domain-containing protein [Francisella sp. LA112445]QIW10700.1 hypothetical protein FIP56_08285 [Francisella sp. LA112445]
MTEAEIHSLLLDAHPHPIVFVDKDYIIRYMNKKAKFWYNQERGYPNMIGKVLFEGHNEARSEEVIKKHAEALKNHAAEQFLYVHKGLNMRLYMTAVRNDKGEFLGFFERFEGNHTL